MQETRTPVEEEREAESHGRRTAPPRMKVARGRTIELNESVKVITCTAAVAALLLPSIASAAGWIPIPASYAPKIRKTIMEPTVQASHGQVHITACTFTSSHRFFTCVFGVAGNPAK